MAVRIHSCRRRRLVTRVVLVTGVCALVIYVLRIVDGVHQTSAAVEGVGAAMEGVSSAEEDVSSAVEGVSSAVKVVSSAVKVVSSAVEGVSSAMEVVCSACEVSVSLMHGMGRRVPVRWVQGSGRTPASRVGTKAAAGKSITILEPTFARIHLKYSKLIIVHIVKNIIIGNLPLLTGSL